MAKPTKTYVANTKSQVKNPWWINVIAGTAVTIDAPFDGVFDNIADIFFSNTLAGTASASDLEIAKNGVSIFTTKPSIDNAAADATNTLAAASGIVVGVLKALALRSFVKGDVLLFTLTAATGATVVRASIGLSELSDKETDITVAIPAS